MSLIIVGMQLAGCSQSQNQADQQVIAKDVDVTEFAALIKSKEGIVLDVRTDDEVASGHIPGAVNSDFYADDFSNRLSEMNKEVPVFVYCAAGGRSGKTKNQLTQLGFKEVYNLKGGFGAWTSANQPVEKP